MLQCRWQRGVSERGVMIALVIGMLLAGACGAFALLMVMNGTGEEIVDEVVLRAPLEPVPVGSFRGVDQLGREVDEGVFRGRWTVLTFGFTHCPTACPIMHGEIARMVGMLRDVPAQVVTMTVDPANDTPEQMRAYVDRFEVSHDRWRFVTTGDIESVHRIVQGLGYFLSDIPGSGVELPDGGTMMNIQHPTRFFLVDPEGRVVLMPSGTNREEVDALARTIRSRLRGS